MTHILLSVHLGGRGKRITTNFKKALTTYIASSIQKALHKLSAYNSSSLEADQMDLCVFDASLDYIVRLCSPTAFKFFLVYSFISVNKNIPNDVSFL